MWTIPLQKMKIDVLFPFLPPEKEGLDGVELIVYALLLLAAGTQRIIKAPTDWGDGKTTLAMNRPTLQRNWTVMTPKQILKTVPSTSAKHKGLLNPWKTRFLKKVLIKKKKKHLETLWSPKNLPATDRLLKVWEGSRNSLVEVSWPSSPSVRDV